MTYMQGAVLINCQCTGLMTVDTLRNIVDCLCFMTAQILMEVVSCKLIYVSLANLTAKQVILSRFMIFPSAKKGETCTIRAKDDERYIFEDNSRAPRQ